MQTTITTANTERVDAGREPLVAAAMLRTPKVCAADATVGDVRACFDDDHLHAVLLVDDGRLVAMVERDDLRDVPDATPARTVGRLDGRTIPPDAPLEQTRLEMVAAGRRRLAVVDDHDRLLGLLCLKRTGLGFCSAADVCARAEEARSARRSATG